MADNPLSNPTAAALPVQERPAVSDVPTVVATPDPIASAAYAALGRVVAEVLVEVRALRTEYAAQATVVATLAGNLEALRSGVHAALERSQNAVAARETAARQQSDTLDVSSTEARYRKLLSDHSVSFSTETDRPIFPAGISHAALYAIMCCGPATTAQTAVQGPSSSPTFADARRVWAHFAANLRQQGKPDPSGTAKRAVLEWLAGPPADPDKSGFIPRYLLARHGHKSVAQLFAETEKGLANLKAAQAAIPADPGDGITKV